MKIYDSFTTDLTRDKGVTVVCGAILGEQGHDVSIEAVWTSDGEVIMPFGQEPDEYIEKARLHNEARRHIARQYYEAEWQDH